jgi:hypothetical protein
MILHNIRLTREEKGCGYCKIISLYRVGVRLPVPLCGMPYSYIQKVKFVKITKGEPPTRPCKNKIRETQLCFGFADTFGRFSSEE